MSCGGALSCEGLTKLFLGLAELFAGSVWISLSFLVAPASSGFLSVASLSLPALKHQQRLGPLNFGFISMRLFQCSPLLHSWVLDSIQGEELIDLGPDEGGYHECCESTAWSCFQELWRILTVLLFLLCRYLYKMWKRCVRSEPGLPSNGQPLSHQLLHMLLLW